MARHRSGKTLLKNSVPWLRYHGEIPAYDESPSGRGGESIGLGGTRSANSIRVSDNTLQLPNPDPEKRHQISYARVEAELAQQRSDLSAVMRLMIEKMRHRDPR